MLLVIQLMKDLRLTLKLTEFTVILVLMCEWYVTGIKRQNIIACANSKFVYLSKMYLIILW